MFDVRQTSAASFAMEKRRSDLVRSIFQSIGLLQVRTYLALKK